MLGPTVVQNKEVQNTQSTESTGVLYDAFCRLLKRNDGLGHLANLFICLFRSSVFQGFTTIIGTVVIGIMISKQDQKLTVACVIYAMFVITNSLVKAYDNRKSRDETKALESKAAENERLEKSNKSLSRCVKGTKKVNGITVNQLVKLSKQASGKKRITLRDAREQFGFQKSAFTICGEIYDALSNYLNTEDHYVTVYQRFLESGNHVCKMIAYWNKNIEEPISYQYPYIIPERVGEDKIEYHTMIFSKQDISIRVLQDKKSVQNKFKFHEGNAVREKEIEQYVGIPIALSNDKVYILLQVDFNKKDMFGKDEKEMKENAEVFLYPFAKQLHMMYEADRLVEVLYQKWYNTKVTNATDGKA